MFVVSFVGNRGTFIRGYKAMVMDMEFLYHVGYILTSVLGLFAHELFYSILVSLQMGWGHGLLTLVSHKLPSVPFRGGINPDLARPGICPPTSDLNSV